ncbi:MAG: TetR/AcrR family transcriptional regulator [Thermoleophilia bacterium]|jgi:AcrR family transcriptional regulator|nr:TetR/AcrR family transcriptional regulator [Thermoleophilia bacterium]
MPTSAPTRKTADERREDLLAAALTEFAARGLDGASTDAIARAAGVSQPYLFRLFGSKKDLFLRSVGRCFDDIADRLREAGAGLEGEAALQAMGQAYGRWISTDPRRLQGQMQCYAACGDPDIRDAVRAGFGRVVAVAEDTGAPEAAIQSFFATGMLINAIGQMGLESSPEPWAARLTRGCLAPEGS